MKLTMKPVVAIVLGGLVTLAGLYVALRGTGSIVIFGWIMAVLGVVGIVGNLLLYRHYRR